MRPALVAALVVAGCASAPRQPPPPAPPGAPEVRGIRVSLSPVVDGSDNDAAWAEAPETVVPLDSSGAEAVLLRTVVFERTLYLLVRWPDTTGTNRPSSAGDSGDVLLGDRVDIAFPMNFPPEDPAPGGRREGRLDWWRWDASLTNSSGHASDFYIVLGTEDDFAFALEGPIPGISTFKDREAGGRSADDVLARGQWRKKGEGGEWTVEFARALSTGHIDDVDLGGVREASFSLTVTDSLRKDIRPPCDTPFLRLLLPPAEPEDRQGPFPDPRGGSGSRR